MRRFITTATVLVATLSAAVMARAETAAPAEQAAAAPVVADYTVFLDPPTGFVFVKLPQGWKFVGKSEVATTAALPANVVTSLLPAEPTAVAGADKPAARKL